MERGEYPKPKDPRIHDADDLEVKLYGAGEIVTFVAGTNDCGPASAKQIAANILEAEERIQQAGYSRPRTMLARPRTPGFRAWWMRLKVKWYLWRGRK